MEGQQIASQASLVENLNFSNFYCETEVFEIDSKVSLGNQVMPENYCLCQITDLLPGWVILRANVFHIKLSIR